MVMTDQEYVDEALAAARANFARLVEICDHVRHIVPGLTPEACAHFAAVAEAVRRQLDEAGAMYARGEVDRNAVVLTARRIAVHADQTAIAIELKWLDAPEVN